MKYTLDTKIEFLLETEHLKALKVVTMKELGFDQELLNDYTLSEIEEKIQTHYKEWQKDYLISGWSIAD